MNSRFAKYLSIFLIFLLGGVSMIWTNNHSMLNTGDFIFPSDGVNEIYAILHSWDKTSLGGINYLQLGFMIPYGLYLAIMRWIGASSVYSQIIWNYLLLTSMGLSMYYLVIVFIRDETKYLAGLIAALFFMFNPWTGQNIAMFFPFITFIPLILGLYIKGLNENKDFKHLVLCSLIWLFVSSFSLRNFRGYIFLWLILFSYLMFFSIINRKKIRHALAFTFIFTFLHILLNFHWILSFFTNILKSTAGSIKVYQAVNYPHLSSFETSSSTIVQSIRLLANWFMTANIKGVPHFPWIIYYQYSLLTFIGFLLPFSVLISLLYVMKEKLNRNIHFIFFFFLLLFGYFITMGKYNPLSLWLTENFQLYLLVFKAPSDQGGLIFILISYSVLLAYSLVFVCHIIKNSRLRLFIGTLYILAIIIYGFPIISGQFIPSGNKLLGAGRYEIPKYVFDLKKKIHDEELNYRLFSVPFSKLGYFAYSWAPGGYNGPDPLVNVLSKSQVIDTGIGAQIADTTVKNIDKTSFFRLNSLLNVKYIMNKRDANLLHIKNNSWYTVPDQAFLNSLYEAPYDFTVGISSPRASSESKSLRSPIGAKGDQNNAEVSTFGQIDLIKIPDELFLPKLYTPLKVINASNVTELPNIVSQKDYVTRSAIYVGNHPNIPNLPNTPNTPKTLEKTILEYRTISPVKYRVRVHNAAGAFPLVMSESFHEGWKMYLTNPNNYKLSTTNYQLINMQGTIQNDDLPSGPIYETWFKKPVIEDANHLMVNGYANSWIVDTNKLCHPVYPSKPEGRRGELAEGSKNPNCFKNPDGTYDFELVIEFWPQRLYYLGLAVSGTTLLGCLSYLVWAWIHGRKRRVR